MCTVTVKVDADVLRGMDPGLDSPAAIRRWAQQLIDHHIQELMAEDAERAITHDMSVEELYDVIEQDVKAIYAECP